MTEIAYFVSPHGYGHATRSIAVVEALQRLRPDLHVHFFTTVPESLFRESLRNFTLHPVEVDIGLVQSSALDFDIPATIKALDTFSLKTKKLVEEIAAHCRHCPFIICDIAPLGIEVAEHLGVPSILVENFTWPWIYQQYLPDYPELNSHIDRFERLYKRVSFHIQTEPFCLRGEGAALNCGPIYRRVREAREVVRQKIGCAGKNLVVLTMGGFSQQPPDLKELGEMEETLFLFSGQEETRWVDKNILLQKRDSDIYHPDLLCAADLVVCKAGYSTVAECCQAGARVLAVVRSDFAESGTLQSYLEARLGGVPITAAAYQDNSWLSLVASIMAGPKPQPSLENGADEVASFLLEQL